MPLLPYSDCVHNTYAPIIPIIPIISTIEFCAQKSKKKW